MAEHNNDNNELGRAGEARAWVKLSTLGCDLKKPHGNCPYDLEVGLQDKLFFVEVKIARPKYDEKKKCWQYKATLRNHKFDILIFFCKLADDEYHPFIIPAAELTDVTSICITSLLPSNYTGKYAEFYQAWHLFSKLDPVEF